MKLSEIRTLIESASDFDSIINILEGVDDPGILKGVFLAGGPGSGKSFTAKDIFGIPTQLENSSFSSFGLKVVNSDRAFETLLNKSGLGTDLAGMSDAEFEKALELRQRAKELTQKMERNFIDGRLGLILDQTSKRGSKVKKQKTELESFGYDTFLVFVNTTLEIALERNRRRSRKLEDELVKNIWGEAQNMRSRLQGMFGANFVEIDNSKEVEPSRAVSAFPDKVNKAVAKFVTSPVKNPVGVQWIKRARKLKKQT